jgi:hypothetical protein
MEKVFAIASSHPNLCRHSIYPYRTILKYEPEQGPYSWGFAYNSKPPLEISSKRRPNHLDGVNFFETLKHHPVALGMGNIKSSKKNSSLNNTMPFRYRSWFFSMTGKNHENQKINNWLSGTLPPFLKRNIQGNSEQELVFHLFLSYLYDSGLINAYDFPISDIISAICKTCDTWQLFCKDTGEEESPGVFIISNGRFLLVMASHDNIAGYKYIDGIHNFCPYCRDTSYDEAPPRTHEDLKTLFVLGDLETNPREYGLSPVQKDKILVFHKNQFSVQPGLCGKS